MQNMSYCKFENTLEALRECLIDIHLEDDEREERSDYESRARIELISLCREIAAESVETE